MKLVSVVTMAFSVSEPSLMIGRDRLRHYSLKQVVCVWPLKRMHSRDHREGGQLMQARDMNSVCLRHFTVSMCR